MKNKKVKQIYNRNLRHVKLMLSIMFKTILALNLIKISYLANNFIF